MCQLASAATPGTHTDPLELMREEPSYTIDSINSIREIEPGPVHWLIGADQLPRLHTWHRFDELLTLCQFVIARRPGFVIDPAPLDPRVKPLLDHVVEIPQIEISSTTIRHRIARGLPIDHLTPPAVVRYILDHGLYRA